jgi:hypothetical protein
MIIIPKPWVLTYHVRISRHSLMLQCWEYEPQKRPNFKEIRIFLSLQLKKATESITSTESSVFSTSSHGNLNKKTDNDTSCESFNLIKKHYNEKGDEADETPDEDDTTPNSFLQPNGNKFDFETMKEPRNNNARDSQYYSGAGESNSLSSVNDTFSKATISKMETIFPDSIDSNYESGSSSYYSSAVENKKPINNPATSTDLTPKTFLVHLKNETDSRKYRHEIVKKFLLSAPGTEKKVNE